MNDLAITGSGTSFAVSAGGRVIARRFTSHGNAVAALPGIEARLRPVQIRRCLCCKTHFTSTGPGNRLCATCKRDT
jgi:hypothetical protein